MPDETYKLPEQPAYRAGSIRKLRDTDLADSCQTFNPLVEGIPESVEYLNQNKAGLNEGGKIDPGDLPTNVPNGVAGLDDNGKVPATQLPEMNYVPSKDKGKADGVAGLDASDNVPENQLPALGGHAAQATATSNTKLLWIDTANSNILKFYDAASKTWKPVGAVWVAPYIGERKITDLCDGDIQRVLDKAAALGRSKKTIQDINGIINRFLKWCRRNRRTTYRPDDVHIPASARLKGKNVLQPDDLITLLSVDTTVYKGKRVREEYIHAYRFQVLTGLRPGELRGLRWEDIDGDRVFVRRSINVFGEETQGKNENAVRSFVLSELAQKELTAQAEEHSSESGYVFELPSPTAYRERWQKYCDSNCMTKTTPYELRHTFVSVAKTLPAGEIKSLVGHSQSMDTFGVYGHALVGEDVRTAEKINELFERLVMPSNSEDK